mgnify:CR=1 FL=1
MFPELVAPELVLLEHPTNKRANAAIIEIIFKNLEWKINNRFSGDKIKEEIFKIVKYKILTEKKEKIMEIYDINCEIYARIYRGAEISKNYREFLENTKSRNLSNRRVERIILNILLNIKAEMMDFEINYVRILGFDKKGQKYLKKRNSSIWDNEQEKMKNLRISRSVCFNQ